MLYNLSLTKQYIHFHGSCIPLISDYHGIRLDTFYLPNRGIAIAENNLKVIKIHIFNLFCWL